MNQICSVGMALFMRYSCRIIIFPYSRQREDCALQCSVRKCYVQHGLTVQFPFQLVGYKQACRSPQPCVLECWSAEFCDTRAELERMQYDRDTTIRTTFWHLHAFRYPNFVHQFGLKMYLRSDVDLVLIQATAISALP